MSSPGDVTLVTVQPRAVAGISTTVPRGRIGAECTAYLDRIYVAGRSGAIALDGQNVFIYRAATRETLTVDFCVGVTAPFEPVGDIRPLETPGGTAARILHVGSYERISESIALLLDWCRANGRPIAGPSWEVYGHWTEDEAKLETEIYFLLRDAIS